MKRKCTPPLIFSFIQANDELGWLFWRKRPNEKRTGRELMLVGVLAAVLTVPIRASKAAVPLPEASHVSGRGYLLLVGAHGAWVIALTGMTALHSAFLIGQAVPNGPLSLVCLRSECSCASACMAFVGRIVISHSINPTQVRHGLIEVSS